MREQKLRLIEHLPSERKGRPGRERSYRMVLCQCVCGNQVKIALESFTSGNSQSCGCARGWTKGKARTHGQSNSPTWKSWFSMRQRCSLRTHEAYPRYGGRGIKVCKRWESFEKFLEDMGERPSKLHELDRINNNKGYLPKNCRWVKRRKQAQNRRNSYIYCIQGTEYPCAREAAESFCVNETTIINWCQSSKKKDCWRVLKYPSS